MPMLEQHPENAVPREHDFMFLDTEIFLVGKRVREERKEMSDKRRVINIAAKLPCVCLK
jgi:hypothetical protein